MQEKAIGWRECWRQGTNAGDLAGLNYYRLDANYRAQQLKNIVMRVRTHSLSKKTHSPTIVRECSSIVCKLSQQTFKYIFVLDEKIFLLAKSFSLLAKYYETLARHSQCKPSCQSSLTKIPYHS